MIVHFILTLILLTPQICTQSDPMQVERAAPELTPTLSEVIDILADYEVVHDTKGLLDLHGLYGLTSFDTKRIIIGDTSDRAYRRKTVIHELLHVLYNNLGISTSDVDADSPWKEYMHQRTQEVYLQLFGPAEGKK